MEEDDDIMADSNGTNMAAGHPEHSLHTSPPSMVSTVYKVNTYNPLLPKSSLIEFITLQQYNFQ
jgi:hypothetical protein